MPNSVSWYFLFLHIAFCSFLQEFGFYQTMLICPRASLADLPPWTTDLLIAAEHIAFSSTCSYKPFRFYLDQHIMKNL